MRILVAASVLLAIAHPVFAKGGMDPDDAPAAVAAKIVEGAAQGAACPAPKAAGSGVFWTKEGTCTAEGEKRCERFNPLKSNLCAAKAANEAAGLKVNYELFGDSDCRVWGPRKFSAITKIVIHNGGTSAEGNRNTWECRKAASHYTIQRDGAIYQHAGEENAAGNAFGPGVTDPKINEYTIGIELNQADNGKSCDAFKGNARKADVEATCGPTDAQYDSLSKLLKAIVSRTKVTFDEEHIIGHCEVRSADDPKGLDWSRLGLSNRKKKALLRKQHTYDCAWYEYDDPAPAAPEQAVGH